MRVRFYACESIFNTIKAAGVSSMLFFNQIFDMLVKLSEDTDDMVCSACEMVSRYLKELVVAQPQHFPISKFILQLPRHLKTIDSKSRLFLLNWIILLQNTPGISLLPYLPQFFRELYSLLSEGQIDIRNKVFSFSFFSFVFFF